MNKAVYIKFIIQLQSMGHMNLKNNTPRMHHITPFRDEKFINFPLAAYGASIPASLALDLRPSNVPVALTPMVIALCVIIQSSVVYTVTRTCGR